MDQLAPELLHRKRHAVVLDVDNTLTPPRRPLEVEMADALRSLQVPFFLSAGGDLRLVRDQFIEPLHEFGYRDSFDAFLCNGATRYHCNLVAGISIELVRHFRMQDHLGPERFQQLVRIVESGLDLPEFRLPPPMRVIGERIVDRESMINVAPIGRPRERLTEEAFANRRAFTQYDHETNFRGRFLAFLREKLSIFSSDGLFISLGGETSFDIVIQGNDKSFPLGTLLNEGFEQLWYVGDALFEGGNDEAVLQYIQNWPVTRQCPVKAIRVQNWRETISVFQTLGLMNGLPKQEVCK